MCRGGLPSLALLLLLISAALPVAAVAGGDAALAAGPEAARVLPRLAATRAAIIIDGVPDESAWNGAVVVDEFYEIATGDDVAPPVRTVGLLGYDAEFLYVGLRCADPEPAKIRAPYVDRDHVLDQDFAQIDIDARDEGRWSSIFRINPHGVQHDGVFDEATGADDYSPDYHFESAARIDADGWTAEMRIPLSALRYPAGDPQTWRIMFYRLYPRQFRYQLVSGPIPRGSNCWLCFSPRYDQITGLPAGGGLTATPFLTAGASRAGAGADRSDRRGQVGGDLKWQPQPDRTVDLTLQPDFSQVESDVAQIGINNRFALFYPEKRPFFLEGLDLWSSPIAVVNTRTITDPRWGARLTGRPGGASYTLLVAGDRGSGSLVLPGPQGSSSSLQPADADVVLARYRYGSGRSSVGVVATSRQAAGGYHNRVGGADLQWFAGDADHFTGQLLWSSTRDDGMPAAGGHALSLGWDRAQRHLAFNLRFEDFAREFRADSGFVPQTGIRHTNAYAEYNVYPEGRIRRVRPRFYFDEEREPRRGIVSQTSAVGLGVDGTVHATLDWYVRDTGRAADGRLFDQRYWKLSARVLPTRRVPFVNLTARYGDELDIAGSRLGTGGSLGLSATLSATDRLQGELSGERRWLDVPAGARQERLFTASVSRARLLYTFTPRSFSRLVGEWQSLREPGGSERTFTGSALYGYRLNWQSILYLGYDNAPAAAGGARSQELFLKVAYAFQR